MRETVIGCSTYLCIHWLFFAAALTRDRTRNLGISGQCSNPLRHPARLESNNLSNITVRKILWAVPFYR